MRQFATRRARRLGTALLAGLVGAALSLLGAAPAAAHATLLRTDPADGAVLPATPETVTLYFNEAVEVRDGGVRLLDASGTELDAEARAVDSTVVLTPPDNLADGTYLVSWRVVSADSHPVAGGFSFSVGAPSAGTVAIPETEPGSGLRVLRPVTETVAYLGVLGGTGLMIFGLTLAPVGRSARVRRDRIAGGLGAAAALALLLLIPVTVAWQDGSDLAAVFDGETWATGLRSDPALSSLLALAGLAVTLTAGWYAGRSRHRPALTAVAFGGAALALGALALVGHTRTFGPAWLVVGVDLLHLATAAVWLGGILGLAVTLSRGADVAAPAAARTVGAFSRLAALLVGLLGVAGVLLGWRILRSWSALFDTGYGWTLLAKTGLVLVVLAVAGWNRFRLVPRVAGRPDDAAARTGLRRTVRAEALLLVGVLAATGLLVTQSPIKESTAAAAPAGPEAVVLEAALGTGRVTARITPGAVGINSLELSVLDAAGRPVEPVEPPKVTATQPEYDIGPLDRPLAVIAPGRYEAVADFPLAGEWVLTVSVRTSKFENPIVEIPVVIR
ncbi:copper resistance protein CopC [Solwaraspora sp. WMMD1047]|uniref:copper resistance CopC/CopD family protein n=1 Tax=Solwaraspora sp. WMMD1047 TaxID=3016102 RepID=UPI0024167703|nr:copper resistance protein CopC [Solwaraspora sp. WMMD1047]MDG4828621.1 copper resistance protein CopC [Solwaraspora sp. WMMD1047]